MTVIHRNDCHNDYVALKKTKMTITMTMSQKMTKFKNDHLVTVLSEMTVTMTTSLVYSDYGSLEADF